jgi:hypothetical protein
MPSSKSSNEFPYEIILKKNSTLTHFPHDAYSEVVRSMLQNVLPPGCFTLFADSPEAKADQLLVFNELLPFLTWSKFDTVPFTLSFYLICKLRHNAFKFFYEMISSWLIPGNPPDIQLFFAVDFCMPELSDQTYTASEIIMKIETEKDFRILQRNLPIIETELRLGVNSLYQASRILEVKGLSSDVKTAMIQEHIVSLLNRLPNDFQYDIFAEMQHFLVICREDFKALREYRHMARIISVLYLFRKSIRQSIQKEPEKRHLSLKLFKARLHPNEGTKVVLGIMVGINFLKANEFFDERHVVKAIQNHIPNVQSVESSLFLHRGKGEPIGTIYLEVEKEDGADFTLEEIKLLTHELPSDLKDRIEHLVNPVFMPPNEEEILKNIVLLSEELTSSKDIPQVIISFDKQTDQNVSFTVILLRILKENDSSISSLFESSKANFLTDQVKVVGHLKRTYPKEANVFRLEIGKVPYLREDHSVDLFRARVAIVDEIQKVLGEFRDYNGGMICKQNELFIKLKDLIGEIDKSDVFLLENFFYSLTPSLMRAVSDPLSLKTLFLQLLDTVDQGLSPEKKHVSCLKEMGESVYGVIYLTTRERAEVFRSNIEEKSFPLMSLTSSYLVVYGNPCLCYLFSSSHPEERKEFLSFLNQQIQTLD